MRSILLPLCLIVTLQVFSQQIVSVDKSSGRALAGIPIWTLKERNLSVPVSLYYQNGSGVPVGSSDEYLGLGWDISGGGSVSRQLNGLPDDYIGIAPDERQGWLATYSGQNVGTFIHNLNLGGTDAERKTTLETLYNSNDELILDTEPDVFTVDAPGLSLQFVFDKDGMPKPFPHAHVEIETVQNPDGEITSFIIKDAAGNTYHFTEVVRVKKHALDLDLNYGEGIFKNEYDLYKDLISYNSEWMLTRMESYHSGNEATLPGNITFTYEAGEVVENFSRIEFYQRQSTATEAYVERPVFQIKTEYTPRYLKRIAAPTGQSVNFGMKDGELQIISIYDNRRPGSFVKSFELTYESVPSSITGGANKYLRSIQEVSGFDRYPPYIFTYNDEENFPAEGSFSVDYWGYFNAATNNNLYPSLDIHYNAANDRDKVQLHRAVSSANKYTLQGADRLPNAATVSHAMLKEVKLPMGDRIRIDYEPNVYFDSFLNQEVAGPGVRVKSLNRFENRINSFVNEIISFYYTADRANYTTGASSGKISGTSKYHIRTKNYVVPGATPIRDIDFEADNSYSNEQIWQYLTLRTDENLGSGSQVLYSEVIEQKSGENGLRISTFLLPPVQGSTDPLWTDYAETSIGNGNLSACQSVWVGSGAGVFPYAPAKRSGNESVLVASEDIVDNTLRLLNRQENTYKRLALNSSSTRGIKLELVPNGCDNTFLFGSYTIVHGVQYAMDEARSMTYEFDGTTNHSMQSTTVYNYNGLGHLYPTAVTTTDAEGNEFRSETVYPSDYNIQGASSGTPQKALEDLVSDHRIGIPVENVSSRKLAGETAFSATAGTYRTFKKANEKIVAATTEALILGQPLSGFQLSDATPQALFPHAQYEQRMIYSDYDSNYRLIKSENPVTRKQNATVWSDQHIPAFQLHNAGVEEVYFNNFTTASEHVFNASGQSITPAAVSGRNDAASLRISDGVRLEGSISSADDAYIVSFWAKRDQNGTLNLELKNSASGSVITSESIPVKGSPDWEFYSREINLSGLNTPAFFVFRLADTYLTYVDDVLIAPKRSSVTSAIVEFPYGVKSATNHITGQSSVTYRDQLGRTLRVEDSRGNTRKLFKYEYANLEEVQFTTSVNPIGIVYDGTPQSFSAADAGMPGVTYQWAFKLQGHYPGSGDYSDASTSTNFTATFQRDPALTAGQPDMRTAYVKMNKAGFSPVVASADFNVEETPPPPPPTNLTVEACYSGLLGLDLCGSSQTLPNSCNSITGTPSNDFEILYGVVSVSGGDGNYTYKWLKREDGFSNWDEIPAPGTGQIAICQDTNYDIKLVATDGQGKTGESDILSVAHTRTNPTCTPISANCSN